MSPPGDRLPARHLSADYRSTAHAQPQSRLDVVGRFASMFAEGERRGATTHSARWSPPANACKTLVKCLHGPTPRSEEHTSELQSQSNLVCRLLLEKKKNN